MRSLALVVMMLLLAVSPARAACTVTGISPSGSTVISVTPNYTGTALTYTYSLNFTVSLSGTGGTCSIGVAFKGTSASPRMTDAGGHFLAYTNPYYYSTTPGTKATGSFANPNTGSIALTLTSTVSFAAGQNAASGTPNGNYQDTTVSLVLFLTATSNTVVGSMPVTITETVAVPSTCTIGGSASGGTQSLDFSNGRTVSTTAKLATFGTVTCNNPATLRFTSSNGAAKSATAAGGGHTNFFNYVASTTVNGGTVSLDTSSVATAVGPESATGRIAALTTTGAPFAVSVTPITPAQPLVAGTYSDVLTITITPD